MVQRLYTPSPLDTKGHFLNKGPACSATAGTGAGTGATVSVTNGTDHSGPLNVTTGTTPAASATVVSVTFAQPYAVAPGAVMLTPANAAAAALGAAMPFVSAITTTGFTVTATATALTASTAYQWRYLAL